MAIYGYARCSTNEERQDINRQKRELKAMGVPEDKFIYYEYESGAKKDRQELEKLLDIVKEGDSIVTTEVSRLTRSTQHLCELLEFVQERKIKLVIGSFVVDCSQKEIDPMTKGMLMMWGVFAEMERDIITQRIKSGMENAKAKGVKIGRPSLTKEDLPEKFFKYYTFYKEGSMNVTDLAKVVGVSRATIYNYLAIMES